MHKWSEVERRVETYESGLEAFVAVCIHLRSTS
jgi:hypothetical protein